MPAVKRDQGRPAWVRLDVDEERRGAEGGETVERVEESRTCGVRGREGEDRESGLDDPRGAMQHLGGREGLGVDGGRFLELEGRLGGDGESRAPPDNEQGRSPGQRRHRLRRGRRSRRCVEYRGQLGKRGQKFVVLAPM